ncbi:uncharacterized protein LOC108466040 [Gossypium arboreum]|uniref:uncharacterized protein LOC108466040 n=1 Tax=Gossypium arboreum TaxID=29729 RepID=UPI0008194E24|nr:uncharacterized protein LOC108466040 [Gossypium arboreum]
MNSLGDFAAFGNLSVEETCPKKVKFRDKERDILVGESSKSGFEKANDKENIDILECDIQKTIVNGMPSIIFFDPIHRILIQSMSNTVILKILGRNIGFSVLQNKIYSIWKPSAPFHMMDIENGYFLVKFQNYIDCEKALSECPWIIFGQYLTVQHWTMAFDPAQAFPSVVMTWIRFPALPSYLYNRKIITDIENFVGKVVKLDMNTDSRTRGCFSRLAVYINLNEPLVSQILINGREQRVEYESLSTICFHCGRYGHVESICNFKVAEASMRVNGDSPVEESRYQNLNVEATEKKDGN